MSIPHEASSLLFAHREYRSAKRTLEADIARLWEMGVLPYRRNDVASSKQWVCGFRVYYSPDSKSISPLLVGPKKPSRFKPRFANITIYEPHEYEIISGHW